MAKYPPVLGNRPIYTIRRTLASLSPDMATADRQTKTTAARAQKSAASSPVGPTAQSEPNNFGGDRPPGTQTSGSKQGFLGRIRTESAECSGVTVFFKNAASSGNGNTGSVAGSASSSTERIGAAPKICHSSRKIQNPDKMAPFNQTTPMPLRRAPKSHIARRKTIRRAYNKGKNLISSARPFLAEVWAKLDLSNATDVPPFATHDDAIEHASAILDGEGRRQTDAGSAHSAL